MSFQLGRTAAFEALAFSLVLLAGMSVGVQLPAAHADCNCFNVIVNPSFENGLNPNNPYPLGWGNWTKHGAPGSTITVDNTTAIELTHSAKLDITLSSLDIGFIALTQDLPENTLFRNVTDRSDGIDLWFRLQPKYAGMGDVRVRILHGENVGELNYVFDADPLLYYPNSTTVDELGRPTGVKSILIPTSSLPTSGPWFHFQRNLRADWQAPLLNRTGGYMGPGFSLDITFLRVQFDALFVRNTLTGAYYAETAWADDFKLWLDIPGATPPLDIDFAPAPASPTAGSTVVFTATASGGVSPYTYAWSFGDDSSGSGSPVSHTYSMPGNFLVTLTVTDSQLSSSTIGHSITVGPPRYSLDFSFTDQNGANVDSLVKWQLFNSTDHLVSYLLGEPSLKENLYRVEAYYPAITGQSPEPYLIFQKQIALTSDLTLSIPLALTPQTIPGNYIAFNNPFNNATVYTTISQQNSTYLRFESTGAPGQYTIIAKIGFGPLSVTRTGPPNILIETWSFDPPNSAIRITTTDLGTFTISGNQALRIPIFKFVDRSGQPRSDIVPRIINARNDNVDLGFQGKIPPDDFLPYHIEVSFRGYTVYREMIGLTTNPSQQQTIQVEIIPVGNGGGNYVAVNRTVTSISLVEYSPFRIAFTIEGSGQSLIIVDAPHRPLYVERNSARIASWTYDGQTNTVAIEAVAQGSFAIILANPPDYSLYLAIAAITTAAAATIVLTYRHRVRSPSTTQVASRESSNGRSHNKMESLSVTKTSMRFENP